MDNAYGKPNNWAGHSTSEAINIGAPVGVFGELGVSDTTNSRGGYLRYITTGVSFFNTSLTSATTWQTFTYLMFCKGNDDSGSQN